MILKNELDCLEDNWHRILFSLYFKMIEDTFQEVFPAKDLNLEVVPESPPDVASGQVVFDAGEVLKEELE